MLKVLKNDMEILITCGWDCHVILRYEEWIVPWVHGAGKCCDKPDRCWIMSQYPEWTMTWHSIYNEIQVLKTLMVPGVTWVEYIGISDRIWNLPWHHEWQALKKRVKIVTDAEAIMPGAEKSHIAVSDMCWRMLMSWVQYRWWRMLHHHYWYVKVPKYCLYSNKCWKLPQCNRHLKNTANQTNN